MLIHVLIAVTPEELRARMMDVMAGRDVTPHAATSESNLQAQVSANDFDILLVSTDFLSAGPENLVRFVRELPGGPEVVVISAREDAEERAAFLTMGCLGVLNPELSDRALRQALQALVERRRQEAVNRLRADRPEEQYSLADFVSDSPSMQVFLSLARRVVRANSSLLLLGETGVGKERLARAVHSEGPRSSGPFIAVNCGALPESLLESELFGHEEGAFTGATRARKGYFEVAHRGTIFLDEIGEMPLHVQVKLLRVLDEHRIQRVGAENLIDIDVRVMAATNRNLEQEVEAGRFRRDLFYRLAVVTLELPPLRERREDIPKLVGSYLDFFRSQTGKPSQHVSAEALNGLIQYDWPGNVRELINTLERAVLIGTQERISLHDLPDRVRGRAKAVPSLNIAPDWRFQSLPAEFVNSPLLEARKRVLKAFETRYLKELLERTQGRIGEAAELAQINERSLYGLLRKHGIDKTDFRVEPRYRRRRADEP